MRFRLQDAAQRLQKVLRRQVRSQEDQAIEGDQQPQQRNRRIRKSRVSGVRRPDAKGYQVLHLMTDLPERDVYKQSGSLRRRLQCAQGQREIKESQKDQGAPQLLV